MIPWRSRLRPHRRWKTSGITHPAQRRCSGSQQRIDLVRVAESVRQSSGTSIIITSEQDGLHDCSPPELNEPPSNNEEQSDSIKLHDELRRRITSLEKEKLALEYKCDKERIEFSKECEEKLSALERERDELKAKAEINANQSKVNVHKITEDCRRDVCNAIRKNLSQCFSETQMRSLMFGTKPTKYGDEDYVQALAFKSVSIKAYRFAFKKWKLPIPSENTVNRWILNMNVQPGHLDVVYSILKGKSKLMESKDKSCIILFAEMSFISEEMEPSDLVGHSSLLVVMARSLLGKWKFN